MSIFSMNIPNHSSELEFSALCYNKVISLLRLYKVVYLFLFVWFFFCMYWRLKARHEAVMRRTLERSQRARPKANRWSWGGALHTNTPSTPAGTLIIYFLLNGLSISLRASPGCGYVHLPPCLHWNFSHPLPSVVTADSRPALPLPLFLPYFQTLSHTLHFALRSPSFVSLPLSSPFLVQVLSSRLCSIHSTLPDWSTCRVLSVSTADTEWPLNVNIIMAVCHLASQC